MALHQLQVRVSPSIGNAMLADRDHMSHRHVLSAFPKGIGASPRAQLNVLWHLDQKKSILTVRSVVEAQHPAILGEILRTTTLVPPRRGERVHIQLLRNCQKTPVPQISAEVRHELERLKRSQREEYSEAPGTPRSPGQGRSYRSRKVLVPEHDREAWALRCLAKCGLSVAPGDLNVGPLQYANLHGPRMGIPVVELTATSVVVDAQKFRQALAMGVGTGRSYGLALIRMTELTTASA